MKILNTKSVLGVHTMACASDYRRIVHLSFTVPVSATSHYCEAGNSMINNKYYKKYFLALMFSCYLCSVLGMFNKV